MSRRRRDVVRNFQSRLLGDRSTVETEASLAPGISELEDRVAKLHRLGSQYAHVRVSRHVENLRQAEVARNREGLRVATEV